MGVPGLALIAAGLCLGAALGAAFGGAGAEAKAEAWGEARQAPPPAIGAMAIITDAAGEPPQPLAATAEPQPPATPAVRGTPRPTAQPAASAAVRGTARPAATATPAVAAAAMATPASPATQATATAIATATASPRRTLRPTATPASRRTPRPTPTPTQAPLPEGEQPAGADQTPATPTPEPTPTPQPTREVAITEIYNAEQNLYEQRFDSKFFYTDTGNGGMVSKPVYVELPAGIDATMERDGVAARFANRTPIEQPGAYVLHLSFTDADGTLVTGLFRFRISAPSASASPDSSAGGGQAGGNLTGGGLGGGIALGGSGGGYTDAGGYPAAGGYTDAGAGGAPLSREAQIIETYHAEQGLFEQNFDSKFFYTDIENGGLTDLPVYFELPAGIDARMERDGVEEPFDGGSLIEAPGTYVFHLSFVDDAGMPVTGLFRFRIMDGAAPPDAQAGGGAAGAGAADGTGGAAIAGGRGGAGSAAAGSADGLGGLDGTGGLGDFGGGLDGLGGLDGVGSVGSLEGMDALSGLGGLSADEIAGTVVTLTGNGVYTGLNETYDAVAGMFAETASSGQSFLSSIPNGAVVSFPVSFVLPGELGVAAFTRDDEPYSYIPGATIAEDGAYCLSLSVNEIANALAPEAPPRFTFRIVTKPVADIDVFNAPWGFSIAGAAKDGEAWPSLAGSALLDSDGLYEFVMSDDYGEAGDLEVSIQRDTTPPAFRLVGVAAGVSDAPEVTVEYLSEDAESVVLTKDGEAVAFQMGGAIAAPGNYRLAVYDGAGNYAAEEFTVPFRLDAASILVIVGVAALLVALLIFVLMRGRRDSRVR
jgi:hypothetical protein